MKRRTAKAKRATGRIRIPIAAPVLIGNERRYVLDCLDTSWISSRGEYIGRFERAFSDVVGARHATACSNGTAGLHLCLVALGIGPGDEVIVPALSYVATVNVVAYVGATPVFVDVDPDTWCMDVAQLKLKLGPLTKAVIPVHLYGNPAPMSPVLELARGRGIGVIEDAAEAVGARYEGRHVGTLGDAGVFSFYANKAITCGHGGMVVTNEREFAERVRRLKDTSASPDRHYWHEEIGFNYGMTNLQAAIGLAQIERFDWHCSRRREIAVRYRDQLSAINGIKFQRIEPGIEHGHWMVTVCLDVDSERDRDRCARFLGESGIETRPVFHPLPLLPPYRDRAGSGGFPEAERVSRTGLTLPTHAGMTAEDVDYICDRLERFLETV